MAHLTLVARVHGSLVVTVDGSLPSRVPKTCFYRCSLHDCIWLLGQVQWMIKTSQSVLIRITPANLYISPRASWENSVEHWMINKKLNRREKFHICPFTIDAWESESSCLQFPCKLWMHCSCSEFTSLKWTYSYVWYVCMYVVYGVSYSVFISHLIPDQYAQRGEALRSQVLFKGNAPILW